MPDRRIGGRGAAPRRGEAQRLIARLKKLEAKRDAQTEGFLLSCFDQRGRLRKLTGKPGQRGTDLEAYLIWLLCALPCERAVDELVPKRGKLDLHALAQVFFAATAVKDPTHVYESFSPLLAALDGGRGKKRAEALAEMIARPATSFADHRPPVAGGFSSPRAWRAVVERARQVVEHVRWDPRWLEHAIRGEHLGMVMRLARPGHDPAAELLERAVLKEPVEVIAALIRIGSGRAVPAAVRAAEHLMSGLTWELHDRQDLLDVLKKLPPEAGEPLSRLADRLPPSREIRSAVPGVASIARRSHALAVSDLRGVVASLARRAPRRRADASAPGSS